MDTRTPYKLRDYQEATVSDARAKLLDATPGDRWLYSSPPGSGKSLIELALQSSLPPGTWISTPRVEIIEGMLSKKGVNTGQLTASQMLDTALASCITTPIRLRNALARGEVDPPRYLIIDEGHHALAETYQLIEAYAPCPVAAFTATPYRGTPRESGAFARLFREHVPIMTFAEATELGYCALPTVDVWPLVDDDVIDVSNGDFSVKAANATITPRLDAIVSRLAEAGYYRDGKWDRPSMMSLPSTELVRQAEATFTAAGLPTVVVTSDTPQSERREAFARTLSGEALLLQIYVVSEGVDLPIRRLIDAGPTLSPVKWFQQFGRITRPVARGEARPEYICTNRNLQRHVYILDGAIRENDLVAPLSSFGTLGARPGGRAVGLENLGRLKPTELPLRSGLKAIFYAFASVEGTSVREYACLLHPTRVAPLWAARDSVKLDTLTSDGKPMRQWGKWQSVKAPEDVRGFASVPPSPVSEKQLAWWKRAAGSFGLDGSTEPTRKQFAALPVLADLRVRLN